MPDEGTGFGQVSMGRSFAVSMGSLIPKSDQRLGRLLCLVFFFFF